MEEECFICCTERNERVFKVCRCNTVVHGSCHEKLLSYSSNPSRCGVCLSNLHDYLKRKYALTIVGRLFFFLFSMYLVLYMNPSALQTCDLKPKKSWGIVWGAHEVCYCSLYQTEFDCVWVSKFKVFFLLLLYLYCLLYSWLGAPFRSFDTSYVYRDDDDE